MLKLLRSLLTWLFSLTADELILWLLPIAGAAVMGLVLSIAEDLEWYTIILVGVISAFISFALLRVVLEGLRWLDRRKPFTVRPIPGGFSGAYVVAAGEPSPLEPTTVYARLEVESARFLRDCSVTVVGMWAVDRSRLMKLAQDPQILCWTGGNDTKQDLTPGVPRRVDVAALNQRNKPEHFQIMRVEHKYPLWVVQGGTSNGIGIRGEGRTACQYGDRSGCQERPPTAVGLSGMARRRRETAKS